MGREPERFEVWRSSDDLQNGPMEPREGAEKAPKRQQWWLPRREKERRRKSPARAAILEGKTKFFRMTNFGALGGEC